ncbi:MAG: hypothetical protein HYV09_26675 [Deltaproteobacteria bacterium]|nr:hypothetical protein [Deltaproteobacteria bacterium]
MQLVSLAADALAGQGWHVVVAAGAADAKFLTHRHRFDLVLCAELPAAHAVCEFVSGHGTSVIVFNDGQLEDAAGGIHVAPRPSSGLEFRAAIESWLARRAVAARLASSPAEACIDTSDAPTVKANRRSEGD